MIALGVTLWVTQNMTAMGDGLYATATTIGLQASGASVNAAQLRSPSFILSMHKDVTRPLENFILAHTGWSALWNSPTLASFWIAEMIIYVVFVGISLSVALVVIEFYLSLAAAAFFVPCVVFAPSSALGEWVVGWVLGGTVRVFMLSLIVGIAVPLVDNLAGLGGGAGADPKWVEVLGLIAGALLFGVIAWTVPARAANFVGHGLGLGAETVMGAAMSAARFGQMATGAAVGAGRVTSRLLTRG
jgi:type IV secretory pathway TrbL component